MLDEKRINEAKNNFKNYLSQNLITKEKFNKLVYDTLIRNHKESLSLADDIFVNNKSKLWLIVISYYSMFYIANAALYKSGYKVQNKIAHKVTADALIVLIKDKIKDILLEQYEYETAEALSISKNIMENFDYEREKRSQIQYETTEEIKASKANTSLKRAKDFSFEIQRFLDEADEKK